jgi:hypothetical protein
MTNSTRLVLVGAAKKKHMFTCIPNAFECYHLFIVNKPFKYFRMYAIRGEKYNSFANWNAFNLFVLHA